MAESTGRAAFGLRAFLVVDDIMRLTAARMYPYSAVKTWRGG
jgi:hypothetical protein